MQRLITLTTMAKQEVLNIKARKGEWEGEVKKEVDLEKKKKKKLSWL